MRDLSRFISTFLACLLVGLLGTGCTKELRAKRHLTRAEQFFTSQEYDKAEIEYLRVLQAVPLQPVAIRQLGTIYLEQGKLPRAYSFLKKALELEPQNVQGHLQLSLAYLAVQERKLAAQEAEWVLAKQPGQQEALDVLVESCATDNEAELMESRVQKLRDADSDRAGYHVALGNLYLKQQNLTNADVEIRKALSLEPNAPSANTAFGNLCWMRNDITNAAQAFKSAADRSSLRSSRRMVFAEFKLRTGAINEAKAELHDITDKAPDYLPAWNRLAQIALEEKDFSQCSTCLQRVIARDPSNFDALSMTGNLNLIKGDTHQAIADFEHLATLYDRSRQVRFQLARAYLADGNTGKAISELNRALALDPNYSDAILLIATINMRKGDTLAAINSLSALLKQQPDLPQVYILLANAYLLHQEPDQAANVCRRMEERFPKSPEVPFLLGSIEARQNHNEEARRAFERSLELSPNFLAALEEIVDLDLAGKQYSAALDRVNRQLQRQPNSAGLRLLLAKIHIAKAESFVPSQPPAERKGSLADTPAAVPEIGEAENALLKSIELDPGLRNSYLLLASLYVSCNKQQQALDRLTAFLSKTNDLSAWMQVGIIQEKINNYSAARDAYTNVLSLNPNFTLALNNLAYLYSEHLGDLNKAYELAERAWRFRPNDPSVGDTLGWVLFKRGEYARALGIIEESASKLPADAEIQFHLGMVHYMLLEEDPARLSLQKAVQSATDAFWKQEAQRRLDILALDVNNADDRTVSWLKQYVHDNPSDPLALCRLAAVQEHHGDPNGAAESLNAALKCSRENPHILMMLARVYASSHPPDNQKAFDLAKKAHSLAPDDPQISALLGHLAFVSGDFKWATILLEESSRKLPMDFDVAYDLAWAYYSVGRESESQNVMQRVLRASSYAKSPDAKRFLDFVSASHDSSASQQLRGAAEQTLVSDPGFVPALTVLARVQEVSGNFAEAAQLYDRILQRFPLFYPALRNLAILYARHLSQPDKAYTLASQARLALPQDAELCAVLGILEYSRANYTRTVDLLRESSRTRQKDPEILYYLGMAHYRLNAKRESKEELQQALALNVESKLAEDARKVLLELK